MPYISRIEVYLLITFTIGSVSCSRFAGSKGKLLAKVGGAELYEADIKLGFSKNDDSMAIKRRLVEDWVKNELTYKKAISALTESEKNKDKEIKSYYESLIRYQYLEKTAIQTRDTIVTGKDIEEYYGANKKNFELKRNIIRFLYVKVPVEVQVGKKVAGWMQDPVRKNMDSLKMFVRKYARNSLLDTAKWYYFSDITKEIPILQDYNPEHFIKSNDYVELQDDRYRYMINIVDGRIKEEIAPLQLVHEKIRAIITNRRKIDREQQIENQLYQEARTQHLFEIY